MSFALPQFEKPLPARSYPGTATLVLFALAVGIALTAYGLATTIWPPQVFWHPPTLVSLAWIVGSITIGGLVCGLAVPRAAALIAVIAGMGVSVSSAGLWPTLTATLVFASGLAVGDRVTRLARTYGASLLTATIDMAMGLGIEAAFFRSAAILPVNTPLFYCAVLIVAIIANPSGARCYGLLLRDGLWAPAAPARAQIVAATLPCALLLMLLLFALLPEVLSDASSIYFPMADFVRRHGFWHFDVARSNAALFSLQTVWPGIAAYVMGGGEVGAKLVNFGFVLLLSGCFYASARTFARPAVSYIGLTLLLSTPVLLLLTESAFYDNSIAALILAALAAVFCFPDESEKTHAVAVVILAAAIGAKITAAVVAPPLAVYSLYRLRQTKLLGQVPRLAALSAPLAALVALPPYIHSYVKTGNPVFPLMNMVFKSPQFVLFHAADVPTVPPRWDFLYAMSFGFHPATHPESYPGAGGFHILLFLPAILVLISAAGTPLRIRGLAFVTISALVLIAYVADNLRYTFILFAPLTLLAAYLLERAASWRPEAGWALGGLAVSTAAVNFWFASAGGGAYRDADFAMLWSDKAKEEYFLHRRGQRFVPAIVNARLGASARVLFNVIGIAGIRGEMLFNAWYNQELRQDIRLAKNIDEIAWVMMKHRITHVVLYPHDEPTPLSQFTRANAQRLLATGDVELWELPSGFTSSYRMASRPAAAEALDQWARVGNPEVVAGSPASIMVDAKNSVSFDFDAAPGLAYVVEFGLSCANGGSTPARAEITWLNNRDEALATRAERLPCAGDGRTALTSRSFLSPSATFTARLSLRGDAGKVQVRSVRIADRE